MTTHAQILLVEDDVNVSTLLARQLRRAGYGVLEAGTLGAARELVKSNLWDLAILDRNLPDGDGASFCRELREQFPHTYLMILTGESSEEAKLQGFELGADDYVTKPFPPQELLARIRAGLRIVELQKALLDSNRQLEELSLTDGLTSLRNRRAFEQQLGQTFEHARRYTRPLSIAVVDIDHFKQVNDMYGHQAGDCVLRAVAQVLDHGTRQTDFVARVGGEEFAILLPETQLFEAMQFGEKIRAAVEGATVRMAETAHRVTVSVGIASIPHSDVKDVTELYDAADQALYRAKNRGRNRVEIEKRKITRRPMQPPTQHRLQIEM
ncbi:MAG TPA: diguanylate cyclase [Thermoanaerobaculia bacterium]|jgi:diguanylate cyclase (GGDEF)-like protein